MCLCIVTLFSRSPERYSQCLYPGENNYFKKKNVVCIQSNMMTILNGKEKKEWNRGKKCRNVFQSLE